MEAWAFHHASPLSIGIAYELMQEGDDPRTRAVCWWLAFKFEEVEPLHIDDILYFCKVNASYKQCCRRERDVLGRINFTIPYHTTVRDIHERLSEITDANRAWLVAICVQRVAHVHSADDWARMISLSTHYTPDVLREIYQKSPRYLRRYMWIVPLRIGLKRSAISMLS